MNQNKKKIEIIEEYLPQIAEGFAWWQLPRLNFKTKIMC